MEVGNQLLNRKEPSPIYAFRKYGPPSSAVYNQELEYIIGPNQHFFPGSFPYGLAYWVISNMPPCVPNPLLSNPSDIAFKQSPDDDDDDDKTHLEKLKHYLLAYPSELTITAARIYKVSDGSLWSFMSRLQMEGSPRPHGR